MHLNKMDYNYDVSVIIVSMNNPSDLIRCLQSIYEFNLSIRLEVSVVFFNYSDENFAMVDKLFGDKIVKHISKGIRGFSANNNIAVKVAKGEYLLILNDDTYFTDNSIELLYNFSKQNNFKLTSPILYYFNGNVQFNGRPKFTILSFLMHEFKLQERLKKYHEKHDGYFLTYNLSGACFMIEKQLFESMGNFDEDYFFTPEDIAVGTIARKKYKIYPVVMESATVFHKGSSTAKKIMSATLPTAKQGVFLFYKKLYGSFYGIIARVALFPIMVLKYCIWTLKPSSDQRTIMRNAFKNALKYNFKSINTTTLFTRLYNEL